MSTPLMQQYARVKAKYPETVLLFRMGDFYETFEEDARVTARVLGITLTKRGNGVAGDVPLAGFPHHALDTYLPKLLKAGLRVAVCEQLEDPRTAKGIVKRDVVEVVTPGVAFSDKVLEQKHNNYLAAIALPSPLAGREDTIGFGFIDVSTAEFSACEFPLKHLPAQIALIAPSEILLQKRDADQLKRLLGERPLTTRMEDWIFHYDYAYELLTTQFNTKSLKGFGVEDLKLGTVAAGAIMNYLQETQKANLHHIRRMTSYQVGEYITLDPATKRNLEITSTLGGSPEGTLFGVLDKTRTPMGGRTLKRWVHRPLNTLEGINERLHAVRELVMSAELRRSLSECLERIGDLERLNTRICTGRANPREMQALKFILHEAAHLRDILRPGTSPLLIQCRETLHPLPDLESLLQDALEDDPPLTLSDGGVIRKGYNGELDDLRHFSLTAKTWIADLQTQERERTGISSLKVGFNNVFGYYIEITHTHRDKIPPEYIRKQTLTNAERFITEGLKEYEEKVLHSQEKILQLETSLFAELRDRITSCADHIQTNARYIAILDSLVSLSAVAVEYAYVQPEVNDSTKLEIIDGRHPVLERLLPPGESYTPNSVRVDTTSEQILIITGPNMSGKSSFLRQTGLIVLLAQIGSFVPARTAKVGIVDRIFTRVGASDNISSGESTFLVEMHEAANIINSATARSLILLDEVGRGTSTFDGISIAWAITEYLHERTGARTLFATHYHELNELASLHPRIKNYKVDVREYGDTVVFLHKVTPGSADHSYGIQVAQMAGLPEEVTDRAKTILRTLEGSGLSLQPGEAARNGTGRIAPTTLQMTLFETREDALREALAALNPENMTPLEALQVLTKLKERFS